MITLKDLEHQYLNKKQEKLYLRRINLDIEKGEIVGIIGRPGAGKSALLKCINLLEQPSTGMISIDKKNHTIMIAKDVRRARQQIGMVNQYPNLLNSKTVYRNIALALELQHVNKAGIVAAVTRIAELLGIQDKLEAYPQQLNNTNKQKVAIARALVINPKILLCDEITNGLDTKTSQTIIQALRTINQELQTTIIFITHDTEIIKNLCDRICVMHHGEIIEQTNAFELYSNPRTEVAKDFIKASTRLEMPWSYRRNLKMQQNQSSHPIVRIVFTGCIPAEMILTYAIENLQIKTIIIQAYQEVIQSNVLNILLIEMLGPQENINEAIQYLKVNNLFVEILGYVNNSI